MTLAQVPEAADVWEKPAIKPNNETFLAARNYEGNMIVKKKSISSADKPLCS